VLELEVGVDEPGKGYVYPVWRGIRDCLGWRRGRYGEVDEVRKRGGG